VQCRAPELCGSCVEKPDVTLFRFRSGGRRLIYHKHPQTFCDVQCCRSLKQVVSIPDAPCCCCCCCCCCTAAAAAAAVALLPLLLLHCCCCCCCTAAVRPTELDGPGRYKLLGIISHMGSNTACGHYVAHVKKVNRQAGQAHRRAAAAAAAAHSPTAGCPCTHRSKALAVVFPDAEDAEGLQPTCCQ